ncbi:ATP synthase regulation protein NCA2-domain-containing protein [Spinellus fusiger]|nr:ATP synthase regulation protein NCA2-domain-containing protein [Spinellus fusiger]
MPTYIQEQVKEIDTVLSSMFENLDTAQLVATEIGRDTDLKTAHEHNDKMRFLAIATQSIDLSSPHTHSNIKSLQATLDLYTTMSSEADLALEWLFVAKCTLAAYAFVFSNVLNSTLPLSECIHYWDTIHGNSMQEAYYALQTAPKRIGTLAFNTLTRVQTSRMGIRSVMATKGHVLESLFPVHTKTRANSHHWTPVQFMSAMSHRPLLLQLIHDEIGQKKKTLERFRSQQAARLGLLIKMTPRFTGSDQEDITSFETTVAHQVSRCAELIRHILEPLAKDIDVSTSIGLGDRDILRSMDALETFSVEDVSPTTVARNLSNFLKRWSTCEDNIKYIRNIYGPLSFVTRYWIPTLTLYFAGKATLSYVFKRKDDIAAWGAELGKTGHDFIVHWIWKPVLKVWGTIRHKDQSLTLLSKEGLRSDLESLERMVANFARDHYTMSEADISYLSSQVREGDMSIVLKIYEQEIKSPIKNVVTGHLVQALLIQIQKTKVDVDLAMTALDKLLKSNELNFAFLAVAPSMLLTWASFTWLNQFLRNRSGQKVQQIGRPLKATLRRVERILNLDVSDQQEETTREGIKNVSLSCESQGILLCEVHLLRSYAHQLPNHNSIREHFMQDLRDLENPKLTRSQKIQTIATMYRYWNFL